MKYNFFTGYTYYMSVGRYFGGLATGSMWNQIIIVILKYITNKNQEKQKQP